MRKLSRLYRRLTLVASVAVLASAGLVPALFGGTASAAIVDSRYIKMSSSAVSAAATYEISWKSGTASNYKSLVVDFCSNSPIVGDTCTAPGGTFTVGTPTVTGTYSTWGTTSSTTSSLRLDHATGITPAVNDVQTITLTTAVNPTALGTFYARILTFAAQSGANSAATYTDTAPGTYIDYGGVAMSTAAQLNITAKVQETLTFCVYTGANCGAGGTAVALGDGNGVLSNTAINYLNANPKFDLASNATHGVIVRMKGATLTSGANTITAHGAGSGACTADSVSTAVEQFGLRATTTGSVTVDAGYACASGNHSLDTTNIATTYGDTLASTTGALDSTTVPMEFAAKAATATEAGVYTATFTFIATGTY